MKKLLLSYIFLAAISSQAFAVDTTISGIDLTDKQVSQAETLKSDVVKGIASWPSEHKVVVVSTRDLTEGEVATLHTQLLALPDEMSKSAIEAQFSFKTLMGRFNQTLPAASMLRLAPYAGALESFVEWKNWLGIKNFLIGLHQVGTLTDEDQTIINSCFAEQGIDLDSVA